jgi:hypothetical protein
VATVILFLKIRITYTNSWLPCKWLGVDVKPHVIYNIQSSFNGSQKLLIQSMGVLLHPTVSTYSLFSCNCSYSARFRVLCFQFGASFVVCFLDMDRQLSSGRQSRCSSVIFKLGQLFDV